MSPPLAPAPSSQVQPTKQLCPLATRDLVERIERFIELFTQTKLYTYQRLFVRRMIEATIDGHYEPDGAWMKDSAVITALWARQSGKTESIADGLLGMAILLPSLSEMWPDDPRLQSFRKGFRAGIYAPIQEQAQLAFDRMRSRITSDHGIEVLAELDIEIGTNRSNTITLSNGSMLLARSASPDTQIEGQTLHFVVCEEAQKLSRSKVDKEISPFLATTNGTMVKIGTAWHSRGGFHSSIQTNVASHAAGGKRNHFEFAYDIVVRERRRAYEEDGNSAHLLYEQYVAGQIRDNGEDSMEFKMNFKCLWHESRVIAVRQSIFTASVAERGCQDRSLESGPGRWGFQVAGLDIGKITDKTVLTLMNVDINNPIKNPFFIPGGEADRQEYRRKQIVDWLELGGSFEGDTGQYRRLVEYLMRTSVRVLCIDATSIGDPVFERIADMVGGAITCVPYKFSSQSKSYLYKYYLQELHSGRTTYASGPATQHRPEYKRFMNEHLDLDKVESGGYSVCEAPEGGHDDYPDSGALAAWAEKIADDVVMPEVTVTSASQEGLGRGRSGGFMGGRSRGESGGELMGPGRSSSRYRFGR